MVTRWCLEGGWEKHHPDFLLETWEVSQHKMFDFSDSYPLTLYYKGRILFPKLAIFQDFLLLHFCTMVTQFSLRLSPQEYSQWLPLKFFSRKPRFSLHSKYKKMLTWANCLPASLEFRARGEQANDLMALTAVWAFVLIRATRLRLVNCTSSHPSSEITAA